MKTGNILICLLVLVVRSGVSQASYICKGGVDHFQVTASGFVQVTATEIFGNGVGRAIFSLTQDWKGVSPEACKSWVAMLLASEATETDVVIQYSDEFSCATQPAWSDASAPHMEDKSKSMGSDSIDFMKNMVGQDLRFMVMTCS